MPTTLAYLIYSFGILFREGLEALLVVVALAAGVRQMGQPRCARDVYAGAGAAVVASVALALVANLIMTDNASDTLEGVMQLVAAATLFFVSSWMTAKSQADRWRDFIEARVNRASRSALPALALGMTAFMAVMREGAETIVFFQALVAGATEASERRAVFAGVAAGAVALLIVFVMLGRAMEKIPLRLFFRVTSFLLYALSVVFLGQGIASLQEAGAIGASFIDHVPTINALGVFPTWQTLAPQAVLIALATISVIARRDKSSRLPTGGQARTERRAVA